MTAGENDMEFESLLEYLRDTRGFDFTGYKRSSLMRRIGKRMEGRDIKSWGEYLDYLQVHPDEFTHLFNFLLINVTSFFRDAQVWDYLSEEIVPRVVKGEGEDGPLRVWCAGCASGEETYSTAMILAEAMGPEEFKNRVKIYATDVDEEALTKARQATYSDKEMEPVPPRLRERYFERNSNAYLFDKDLRRSVIFGRHDLVQDAPISKVDLLLCRNTLMYFNAEMQARMMAHFHFALNEGGFLVLGKAEMLFTQLKSFVPVDLKRRIFTKVATEDSLRDRLVVAAQMGNLEGASQFGNHLRSRDAAFDAGPVAQLLIDRNGYLAMANRRARELFNLKDKDVGRRLQDLEVSYRPIDLRSAIDEVHEGRASVKMSDVPWTTAAGEDVHLDVDIVSLVDPGRKTLGASITFTDVSKFVELQEELTQSNQELETAMEELQSTNEELETTNEELQSTNEELETMNEELQSTNEELQTINEEVRERSTQLNQVNAFLESIMGGIRSAVMVVDRSSRVQLWNDRAEDLWGLRAGEVKGQPFFGLDIGLDVDQLRQIVGKGLERGDTGEVRVGATNRRGRSIRLRISCTPLRGADRSIEGAILVMEDEPAEEGS